ncbi:hypothetical protein IPH67_01905 [bacterium]|nr:MAG: hypothetical protein IPH67_01905 [bacterium]
MERKPTALYLTYPFMRTKDILIKNIMNNNVPLWLIFVYKHGIYHLDLQENSLKTPQELVKLNTDQSILCSCFDRNAKKLYYVAQDNKKTTLKILNIVSLNQDREEERTRAQAEIDQKAKKIQGYLQQTPEEKKKAQARKTEGAAKALEKFVNALTKAQ